MDLADKMTYNKYIWLIKLPDGWHPVLMEIQNLLEYLAPNIKQEITLDLHITGIDNVKFISLYDTFNPPIKVLKHAMKPFKDEKSWQILSHIRDNIPIQSCSSDTQRNIYAFMMKNSYIDHHYYQFHYYLIYQKSWYIIKPICIFNKAPHR